MNHQTQGTKMMVDKESIYEALKQVVDPELGLSVVDLGLIYGVEISQQSISVTMTATSVGCPYSLELRDQVHEVVRERAPEAESVEVKLVWSPPWQPTMLSQEAKRRLGVKC